jgi:membrane protein DedA with SNARE-associated domain
MEHALSVDLLERYALVVLPALVVAEQFGIPLPAVPMLLGFGALVAHGRGSIPVMLAALVTVTLTIDFAWYELGRRRGAFALGRLCRLAVEPDTCVRRAENVFSRFGVAALLVAKFLPGMTTIVPPLAGVFGVKRVRFAVYDIVGVLLWSGTWIGLGYVFSDAVATIAARVAALGVHIGVFLGTVIAGYIVIKYVRRQLLFRKLRIARMSPEELKRRLDAGEDITIVDLRTRLEIAAMPYVIPGSRWMDADAIDAQQAELLGARELVVYCT